MKPTGNGDLIELVCPTGQGSSVSGLLARTGPGPYHLAYCVENLDIARPEMKALGFRLSTKRTLAPALGNRPIEFWHSPTLGLVELIEWR